MSKNAGRMGLGAPLAPPRIQGMTLQATLALRVTRLQPHFAVGAVAAHAVRAHGDVMGNRRRCAWASAGAMLQLSCALKAILQPEKLRGFEVLLLHMTLGAAGVERVRHGSRAQLADALAFQVAGHARCARALVHRMRDDGRCTGIGTTRLAQL